MTGLTVDALLQCLTSRLQLASVDWTGHDRGHGLVEVCAILTGDQPGRCAVVYADYEPEGRALDPSVTIHLLGHGQTPPERAHLHVEDGTAHTLTQALTAHLCAPKKERSL